ncbi:DUF4325 domain-containing protein [Planctomonas sp. JC2975]|uniref:STAS-like domain-containing protein n=1 Tax=Planctomonas sp. JC2975 TaxID=2729626 RepID=UPI0014737147|nr:DUF4325 domain-containing protein [Planctomonas sp. JC2975]
MIDDQKQLGIGQAAELLGISASYVRTLADRGVLTSATTAGGHRRFDERVLLNEWAAFRHATPARPGWSDAFDLAGLDESFVWGRMRDEVGVDIPQNAHGILAYAVTEMVNNAIDHSSGTLVEVSAAVSDRIIDVRIADDGVGAFETIRKGHGLPDAGAALVELTKGKRTTAPDRHAGEGLFFTLRAVDYATVSANGYVLAASQAEGTDRFASGSSRNAGTVVTLRLHLDTDRGLTSVFEQFAPVDEDGLGGFTRTEPRISLVTYSGDFISRSEAKRFAAGLEKFETVTLDFEGLDLIGQGFADELFRVWQRDHPEVELKVAGASRGVRLMIDRARRPAGD